MNTCSKHICDEKTTDITTWKTFQTLTMSQIQTNFHWSEEYNVKKITSTEYLNIEMASEFMTLLITNLEVQRAPPLTCTGISKTKHLGLPTLSIYSTQRTTPSIRSSWHFLLEIKDAKNNCKLFSFNYLLKTN